MSTVPPPEPWQLAIDFGTSFIVAAGRRQHRPPEVIELGGERTMPSVVVIDGQGGVVVGRPADNLAAAQPNRALRAPKSRLGDPAPVVLGGRAFPVVELIAAQLQAVYAEAVATMGAPPVEVRLTHPATWPSARTTQLLEAAARAGIDRPVLVPEPVAAAAAYAEAVGVVEGGCVAVYDLGGGTFDSAVLQAVRGGFVIVGRPGGEDRLGGNLFDELLTNHIGARLDPAVWEALQVDEDLRWRQAAATLRTEARRAKEALSTYPMADVLVGLPGGMAHLQVSRAELDELTRPYLHDTVLALERTILDAGLRPQQLSAIFLTGGASRMPAVGELVAAAFPTVEVSRRGDPKTAVALGATHQLAAVSGAPRRASDPPAPPPLPPVVAVDPAQRTVVVPLAGSAPATGGAIPPGMVGGSAAAEPGGSVGPGGPVGAAGPIAGAEAGRGRRWPAGALAVLGIALLAVTGALLWRSRDDGNVAIGPDGSTPSSEPVDTSGATTSTSVAPTSSASTAPASTVPASTTSATTTPSTAPATTAPPPSTAPPRVTCPSTALEQNRSPGGATIAVEQFTTEGFIARLCWSGSEYLWFGYDRGNPSSSVLLGAVRTASGWQAAHNGYLYQVDAAALVVTRGSETIVNDPVLSYETY